MEVGASDRLPTGRCLENQASTVARHDDALEGDILCELPVHERRCESQPLDLSDDVVGGGPLSARTIRPPLHAVGRKNSHVLCKHATVNRLRSCYRRCRQQESSNTARYFTFRHPVPAVSSQVSAYTSSLPGL